MRELKKKWIFLLACLLAAFVLPACGAGGKAPVEGPAEGPESEPDVTTLTYAALNPISDELTRFVALFNKNHEDVRMEILDYSDEGGLERLRTELVLGQVPDIMEMHYYGKGGSTVGPSSREYYGGYHPKYYDGIVPGKYTPPADEYWMPYRQMVQKGYLEDLWPYIENDPQLGREGVLQAPLKAAEVNGGLYMLFQRVQIFTLIGRESVVGDRYSWTLEELMDAYAAMPEGSTILRYNMTRQDLFFNLLCHALDGYIDWTTGECHFDSQSFRDLVGFLEKAPDEVEYEKPKDAEYEVIERIMHGQQMLEGMIVLWPREIGFSDTIFQERAAFVGYPTADGSSGSFFYPTGEILAMSATCKDKDAAWDYIRLLIKPRRSKAKPYYSFMDMPINLHDYELLIWGELKDTEKALKKYPEDPLNYSPKTDAHFRYVPEIPLMRLLAEEDGQRYRDLVDHTTRLYWGEDALSDIVWVTLGSYFAGDRTLDEAVELIQNRVRLYVNENM